MNYKGHTSLTMDPHSFANQINIFQVQVAQYQVALHQFNITIQQHCLRDSSRRLYEYKSRLKGWVWQGDDKNKVKSVR